MSFPTFAADRDLSIPVTDREYKLMCVHFRRTPKAELPQNDFVSSRTREQNRQRAAIAQAIIFNRLPAYPGRDRYPNEELREAAFRRIRRISVAAKRYKARAHGRIEEPREWTQRSIEMGGRDMVLQATRCAYVVAVG